MSCQVRRSLACPAARRPNTSPRVSSSNRVPVRISGRSCPSSTATPCPSTTSSTRTPTAVPALRRRPARSARAGLPVIRQTGSQLKP